MHTLNEMGLAPTTNAPNSEKELTTTIGTHLGNTNPIQKSTITYLRILSNAFQNGTTRSISTNDHREDAFQLIVLSWGQANGRKASGWGNMKKVHKIKSS